MVLATCSVCGLLVEVSKPIHALCVQFTCTECGGRYETHNLCITGIFVDNSKETETYRTRFKPSAVSRAVYKPVDKPVNCA
jgi:hypothetical protein